jgi:hypothetical protein
LTRHFLSFFLSFFLSSRLQKWSEVEYLEKKCTRKKQARAHDNNPALKSTRDAMETTTGNAHHHKSAKTELNQTLTLIFSSFCTSKGTEVSSNKQWHFSVIYVTIIN